MDDNQKAKMLFMLDRQDEAYHSSPSGSFIQRLIPGVCKHESVRCIHGDEIIGRGYRRVACLICGRAIKGDLPKICFFTGEIHPSYKE